MYNVSIKNKKSKLYQKKLLGTILLLIKVTSADVITITKNR
jgi:hypothetical protein